MASFSMLLVLFAIVAFAGVEAQRPPRGNTGVWVYDHPDAEPPAQWTKHIKQFNRESSAGRIDHVVLYGSDMEHYESDFCCKPISPPQAGRRLEMYGSEPNTTLTFIVDGRMGGEQEWAPNLAKLTPERIAAWANWVAQWVCAYDQVDGVQVDLEPIAGPWNANLKLLLKTLSTVMTSRDYGCSSPSHPQGRALSTFAHQKDVDEELLDALGPLGYVVISGYDLGDGGAGSFIDPITYEKNLRDNVKKMSVKAATYKVPYMVGVPAAASTYEFETYLKDGTLIKSGYSQRQYVEKALKVLQEEVLNDPYYLGPMLWTLSFTNTYPPHSPNIMRPTSAYANPDVWEYLQDNLDIATPRKATGFSFGGGRR